MSQLEKSTKQFYKVLLLGFIIAPVLGILSGYIRMFVIKHDIVLIAVGLGVSYAVREIGKGMTLKFSLLAVGITLVAIILSDIVTTSGILGLASIDAYLDYFGIFFNGGDLLTVLWLIYRGIALYVAYVYARVI